MGVISIIPAEPHSGESRNPKLTTAENHSFRDYGFRFRAELVIGHFNPSPLGTSRNGKTIRLPDLIVYADAP